MSNAVDAWRAEGLRLLRRTNASPAASRDAEAAIAHAADLLEQALSRPTTRARAATSSRATTGAGVLTCVELTLPFLQSWELAKVSQLSGSIRDLASKDHVWEALASLYYAEAVMLRREVGGASILKGKQMFVRMWNLWRESHKTEGPGPWNAPGLDAYKVLVCLEADGTDIIVDLFPLTEGDDLFEVNMNVQAPVMQPSNTESLEMSLALVRMSDGRLLHILTDGGLFEEDENIMGVVGSTSRLTTLGCGMRHVYDWDSVLMRVEHYVDCTDVTFDVHEGERVVTGIGSLSLVVRDPSVPNQQGTFVRASCRQLLEAYHVSNSWV